MIKGKSFKQARTKKELRANYEELYNLLYGKFNIAKLKKKIESGKYRAIDYFYYELLTSVGKESRQTVFKKLYPDSVIQDIHLLGSGFDAIRLDK